jgi:CPA1 family monovalent cation:H+ antiporter
VLSRDADVSAALAGLAVFAGVPAARREAIDPAPEVIDVLEGETIVREGRYDHEWYVVLEGTAAATAAGTELGLLEPGDQFGEIALLSRRPRRVSVRAVTPMRVLMLTEKAFLALLEDCAPFTYAVLATLAERASNPRWPDFLKRPAISDLGAPGSRDGSQT